METGTVGYICTAPEHPPRSSREGMGLTINEGQWAFCAAGEATGHRWSAIDRASFADLARAASSASRAGEVVDD
jgi:hypothetical protein